MKLIKAQNKLLYNKKKPLENLYIENQNGRDSVVHSEDRGGTPRP